MMIQIPRHSILQNIINDYFPWIFLPKTIQINLKWIHAANCLTLANIVALADSIYDRSMESGQSYGCQVHRTQKNV